MPDTVFATYRIAAGHEPAFLALLRAHWHALHAYGLVTGEPSRTYRMEHEDGEVTWIEVFTWKPGAAGTAHDQPVIAQLWDQMRRHVAEREGEPQWSFPHYEEVSVVPTEAPPEAAALAAEAAASDE